MLSLMLKSGTLLVWNSLKVLNDRSWRDSGSVLLSYLSEDLVGHYLGRASFLVLREFLSGILTAGSRHEIMISDAPQHEWEAEDGKLGERGVYQRIYHQLSGDVPPSPLMRDCSVGLSLPDAQWAPPPSPSPSLGVQLQEDQVFCHQVWWIDHAFLEILSYDVAHTGPGGFPMITSMKSTHGRVPFKHSVVRLWKSAIC